MKIASYIFVLIAVVLLGLGIWGRYMTVSGVVLGAKPIAAVTFANTALLIAVLLKVFEKK